MNYRLLSVGNDSKTIKGEKYGYLTGILYLLPASLSGKNLCPGSSAGCRAACLNDSGRSVAFPAIHKARARKSRQFIEDPQGFLSDLVSDITKLDKDARKKRLKIAVRLGGTSDIAFENIKIGDSGKSIMEHFPEVQFYDYSKVFTRFTNKNKPKNLHLTFSLSEKNEEIAKIVSQMGHNVAVVFNTGKSKDSPLPKKFWDREVLSGDDSDLRFLDKKGAIIGLKAKGKAKNDKSGFVKVV